jgi:hypothetical protein
MHGRTGYALRRGNLWNAKFSSPFHGNRSCLRLKRSPLWRKNKCLKGYSIWDEGKYQINLSRSKMMRLLIFILSDGNSKKLKSKSWLALFTFWYFLETWNLIPQRLKINESVLDCMDLTKRLVKSVNMMFYSWVHVFKCKVGSGDYFTNEGLI